MAGTKQKTDIKDRQNELVLRTIVVDRKGQERLSCYSSQPEFLDHPATGKLEIFGALPVCLQEV